MSCPKRMLSFLRVYLISFCIIRYPKYAATTHQIESSAMQCIAGLLKAEMHRKVLLNEYGTAASYPLSISCHSIPNLGDKARTEGEFANRSAERDDLVSRWPASVIEGKYLERPSDAAYLMHRCILSLSLHRSRRPLRVTNVFDRTCRSERLHLLRNALPIQGIQGTISNVLRYAVGLHQ